MRLIDADALMNYCNNLKDKTVDANDIARFPTVATDINVPNKWISVKERLPEQHFVNDDPDPEIGYLIYDTVLVYYDSKVLMAVYETDDVVPFWWIDDYVIGKISGVDYWMPLPEPPKEDEVDEERAADD